MTTLRSPSRGLDPGRKTPIFGHFGHLSSLGRVITGWNALNLIEMGNPDCILLDSMTKFWLPSGGPDPGPKTPIFRHFGHFSLLGHKVTGWITLNSIEMSKNNCALTDSINKHPLGGAAGGLNRPNWAFWRSARSELWNLNDLIIVSGYEPTIFSDRCSNARVR